MICGLLAVSAVALAQGLEAPSGVRLAQTFHVTQPAQLQPALAAAQGGDTVLVDPSVTLEGSIELPVHPGDGWVTVRTAGELPEQRIGLEDVPLLPVIRSIDGRPPLTTADGAHHWRVQGLALEATRNTYGRVRIGRAEGYTSHDQVPHHIELDRLYVPNPDTQDERRGVQLHGDDLVLRRSYVACMHEPGADSQAAGGWEGASRLLLEDNSLCAASEPILFGGASSSAVTPVPEDIVIRGNHIWKPLRWLSLPAAATWNQKNLLELKSARRVLIQRNRLENNWPGAQTGWSVLLTARGSTPWMVLEDVTVEDNEVLSVAAGLNILGCDNDGPSGTIGRKVTIRRNRWVTNKHVCPIEGDGRCYMLLGAPADVSIDQDVCLNDGSAIMAIDVVTPRLRYTNSFAVHGTYGIVGTALAPGASTMSTLAPDGVFAGNVFAECGGTPYPAGVRCVTRAVFDALVAR